MICQRLMSEPVRVYIERLKAALNVSTDEALAQELGYSKQAIANWRRRGKVPIDAELRITDRYGADLARTPALRNVSTLQEDEIVYGAALLAFEEISAEFDELPSPQRELLKGRVFREIEEFFRKRLAEKNLNYSDHISIIDGILHLVGDDAIKQARNFARIVLGSTLNLK